MRARVDPAAWSVKSPAHSARKWWRVRASQGAGTVQPDVIEWDIVRFEHPAAGESALGRVSAVASETLDVELLVPDTSEPGVFVLDPDGAFVEGLPRERVLAVVEHEYSQRQAREHNPHSEHAEDVFRILE